MKIRDDLYKQQAVEKDPENKSRLNDRYKRYRNLIVSLLKRSKKNHYNSYFLMNQGNVKKTWNGIRSLINISKKKLSSPIELVYSNKTHSTDKDIGESLNHFFLNIGSTVEEKIPK